MPKTKDVSLLPFLDTFAAAAEVGSFTAVGVALGVTQAAISQRIQALERVLDTALFERTGNHVVLTETGQRLYPFAQRIQALNKEACEAISSAAEIPSGELSLVASSVPGEHLLPRILKSFHEQFPRILVKGSVLDSRAALEIVLARKAEVGLVGRKDKKLDLLTDAQPT